MEIIRGKKPAFISASEFDSISAEYKSIHVDIGTGDGRFVQNLAQKNRDTFIIGVDACRENVYDAARRAPTNALFVIANAYAMPSELQHSASHITVNFPWGSLLEGLVRQDAALLDNLINICQPKATIDIYLNGGALKEAGYTLENGVSGVRSGLTKAGFFMQTPLELVSQDLKAYPTTWAKRLAFGRDPRAVYLRGIRKG